ncbi:hypothetical protein C0075_14040 [Rhizobium sp. KAs_5_22]|nr:hypothetical protein C0075_14040 [Rhizobium sp. KAs_5_22]
MGGSEALIGQWKASGGDEMANLQCFSFGIRRDLYDQLARRLIRARKTSKQPLLDSLAALGRAKKVENGRLAA